MQSNQSLQCLSLDCSKSNRIYHRYPIRTEKSQPEGKWIMLETRFTEFPALSIGPRVGFLSLHWRLMTGYFFSPMTLKIIVYHSTLLLFDILHCITIFPKRQSVFFMVTSLMKVRILTSLLMSHVSCLSPWVRQNFPALLKIEHC